jgi:hypothetical protein
LTFEQSLTIPKEFKKNPKEIPKNSPVFESIQFPTLHLEAENPFGLVLLILTHRWRNSIIEMTLCRVPYFVYYSSLVDNLRSGSMVEFVRNPHERLGRQCFGVSLLETSIYFVQFFSDTQAQWTIWPWKISFPILNF